MNFDRIVSTQSHARQLFIRKVFDHFQKTGVSTEEILAEVSATLHKIFLVLAVADLSQPPHEQSVTVVAYQAVPVRTPDAFDDVPSRAAEDGFEFLNNLSVAAHRTIEALQVAVHNENQIIQILTRSQRNRAERLRLVHFAVAHEGPNFAAGGLLQAAILQIANEAGVVDRLDRAQSHGDRWELPKIRHQPRVWVRTQTAARLQFAAEVF